MNFQSVLKKSVSFFADSAASQTSRQNNAQISSSSTKNSASNNMNAKTNPHNYIHSNTPASSSSSSGHHLNASQMLNRSTIAQRASLKIRQRPLSTYNPQPKSGTVNATRILHTKPFY